MQHLKDLFFCAALAVLIFGAAVLALLVPIGSTAKVNQPSFWSISQLGEVTDRATGLDAPRRRIFLPDRSALVIDRANGLIKHRPDDGADCGRRWSYDFQTARQKVDAAI